MPFQMYHHAITITCFINIHIYTHIYSNRIIPAEMGYLTELRTLDLNGNSLQGVLPQLMFKKLSKLKRLNLHMNDLFGKIPKEIGLLKNLKELTLFGNFFFGRVPSEISNLKKLGKFFVFVNVTPHYTRMVYFLKRGDTIVQIYSFSRGLFLVCLHLD